MLAASVGLLSASMAVAQAEDLPPHAHLHLTGIELDASGDWPIAIKKCKPLANGRAVPNQAHHANLHTGRAADAQWEAGNGVVPILEGEDGTPWTDCASLMDFFFGD
ncbi:MAG: hypothetical protein WEB09_08435 [Nitriliruptor sp.]